MEDKKKWFDFQCQYDFRGGVARIFLEGFEVLHVEFDSENLAKGFLIALTNSGQFISLSEEQRDKVYEEVKERLSDAELNVTNEEIHLVESQAVRNAEAQIIKESIEVSRQKVSSNFPDLILAFWEKLLNLANYTGSNALRELLNLPERYNAKAIETALQKLERERLKAVIGEPARGGARNVKHLWTDEERARLAVKYEELQPVWVEAKRIAKDAQKSRERTRKKEWRAEVLRAYPNLPHDLLERYSNPKADDAKPADLAVIHAKRECGITEEYSPRHLRDQIKAWRLKARS